MNYFCEVATVWQIILLVFSLLTVISLTGGCVLLRKHRNDIKKQIIVIIVLLFNSSLYVLMQVDSRITGEEHALHLPYFLVFVETLVSFGFAVWSILQETKNRKKINNNSIKEAFDNLPTGVCFFNEDGLPVLCNREMHRFSFAVSGKDVQYITDLEDMLKETFVPVEGVVKDDKVFTMAGDKAWQLERRIVRDKKQNIYTEFVVLNVTDLQHNRVQLTAENRQLRNVQAELKKLSANVVAVTREEELLNTKMRVHDEIGRCLVETRECLYDGSENIPEHVIYSWQRAVSMLKYNNETSDEDMLSQIYKTCESIKLKFIQTGNLPKDETAAYVLTCAVRECVTNAVRHADSSELYTEFSENEAFASVTVTNNGKQPDIEIIEGGGLSTLRRRVERAGGSMILQSFPKFKLTVIVPLQKKGMV